MSFAYPLGLIGLIGVPILIIIYIIKNKYTEQTIASTFMWKLSEKFLPKRKPISALSGIICLILQILSVILISLLIAHPIIKIPNAAKEYCFIIDASGSMNMEVDDTTRFEIGKDNIENVINSSIDGSKYTLVYVGATARVVYEKLGDKEKAVELLNKVEPAGVSVNFNNTLKYVQEYFNQNNSLVTYLVTDKDYNSSNIEVINVSKNEINYAITDANYVVNNSVLEVSGNVISYEEDTTINVEIYINDILEETLNLDVKKMISTSFKYESQTVNFNTINIKITNDDSLNLDNETILYNIEKEHQYSALIVSDRPFYLVSAISTVGNTAITTVSIDDYSPDVSGYDLYIYDAVSPIKMPNDGTVWLFGAPVSIDGAGFSVQDTIIDEDGMELTYQKNSSTSFKALTANLTGEQIYVAKYIKYGLYEKFTTILSHEGNPVVFTGKNNNGNREVVFAFDLHDSNLPLLIDYLTLTKNFLDYSFPTIIEESSYTCGDNVKINVISSCESIRVESPKGNVSYLDVSSEMTELKLNEVGTYKLIFMLQDTEKVFNIYSNLPESEMSTPSDVLEINLDGTLENDYTDGIYDKLIVLFIILAVLYMADWVVYCYEQYQIR